MKLVSLACVGVALLATACTRQAEPKVVSAPLAADEYLKTAQGPVFDQARRLGRGVNLGNALDAPKEGEWGITLRDEDFALVAEVGFDHVRIPVRWSAHAASEAPFSIDPEFAARVKWAIDSALGSGLRAIVNVHHYDEMAIEPDAHKARLIGIWKQIAESYQGYPDTLYFELLNEPHDKLTPDKNNGLISELLTVVRATNPQRSVVVGGTEWNSFRGLPSLELPVSDQHLIVTIHYYDPFDFTHQGAEWAKKQDQLGIDWPGQVGTQRNIAVDFDRAVEWARAHTRPLYLGEYGAYEKAELGARTRWTTAVVTEADARAIPSAYWELRASFGLYDLEKKQWRRELLDAVLPSRGAQGTRPAPASDAPLQPLPVPGATSSIAERSAPGSARR
ncbi:MAG: glycoside hydrolase family 5 protein [Deltaproteobacteria bacterium]